MAKVDVLAAGYSHVSPMNPQRLRAAGSCALVLSNETKIIFDTLGPYEQTKLLDLLSKRKIHPHDIDIVVCSHSHPDHAGNIGLFQRSQLHVVGTSVYQGNSFHLDKFNQTGSFQYSPNEDTKPTFVQEYASFDLDSDVRIEPTIGHTAECVTVFVNTSELGRVALAGDLFERESDLTDENVWLSHTNHNPMFQRANRAKVYNSVDYILPGHGPMFKTEGKIK